MFRVLLKIDRVNMKIKEAVELHIIIRKANRCFNHSRKESLLNGYANLATSTEFFIEASNPTFDIQFYLLMGNLKKKGGSISIDLRKYEMNSSHQLTEIIQNTPLHHSTVQLDFVYMQSDLPFKGDCLVSLHQLEQSRHREYLRDIVEQNEKLSKERSRLTDEINQFRTKNEILESQYKELENSLQQMENNYSKELTLMEETRDKQVQNLENEKKKIAAIVDIINSSGNPTLIHQIEDIISNSMEKE